MKFTIGMAVISLAVVLTSAQHDVPDKPDPCEFCNRKFEACMGVRIILTAFTTIFNIVLNEKNRANDI